MPGLEAAGSSRPLRIRVAPPAMAPRSRATVALALCASALQACTAANLGEYCEGSGLASVDRSSLGLVLGAPRNRFTESPTFALYSPSWAKPDAVLQLNLEATSLPWPADLDETPCKGLDWRTFRVEVDSDQWARFLSLPRPIRVEGHIGVTDSAVPLRMPEFGFVLVNVATGKAVMSCGCYWT